MFKGGASGVGAAALSQLCSQAQQTLDATADERVALFKLIESEYAKTKTHLKGLGLLS
jgi:HPt (histidine-containing phosphotransfer) domain-containing protein